MLHKKIIYLLIIPHAFNGCKFEKKESKIINHDFSYTNSINKYENEWIISDYENESSEEYLNGLKLEILSWVDSTKVSNSLNKSLSVLFSIFNHYNEEISEEFLINFNISDLSNERRLDQAALLYNQIKYNDMFNNISEKNNLNLDKLRNNFILVLKKESIYYIKLKTI